MKAQASWSAVAAALEEGSKNGDHRDLCPLIEHSKIFYNAYTKAVKEHESMIEKK